MINRCNFLSKHEIILFPTSQLWVTLLLSFHRTNVLTSSIQGQLQNVRENMGKVTEERNTMKRELETKTQELQEKMRTINQVKKIGRRYKTQYEELKVEHDKVTVSLLTSIQTLKQK